MIINNKGNNMTRKTGLMGLALSLAAVSVLGLTGCGGSNSTTAAVAFNGKFIDSAVGGVAFNCPGAAGLTAADGTFGTCNAGSTVTFSIGGLVLGSSSVTGDGIFFVTDIAGTNRSDTGNEEVLKIASLLQSIDADGNPDNGITIPPEAAVELGKTTANLADYSSADASALTGALVVTLKAQGIPVVYVSPAQAQANLDDTLENIENGSITPPTPPTGSGGGN